MHAAVHFSDYVRASASAFMHDCAWARVCGYIKASQCLISMRVIWRRLVRIWAGGCTAHTTRMASDDISLIPQALSCSLLLDKSSSINLNPWYHTTHTDSLFEKMRWIFFSLGHKGTAVSGIITPQPASTSHLAAFVLVEKKLFLFFV